MADSYDRYEQEGGGGFMMGLLTGTVLGAGLGMLLAPKAGSEMRGAIGEQARNLGSRATDQARTLAERGREMVDKARDMAGRGAEGMRDMAGATTGGDGATGTTGTTGTTGGYGGTTGSTGEFGRS